jgi:hypothetical protein
MMGLHTKRISSTFINKIRSNSNFVPSHSHGPNTIHPPLPHEKGVDLDYLFSSSYLFRTETEIKSLKNIMLLAHLPDYPVSRIKTTIFAERQAAASEIASQNEFCLPGNQDTRRDVSWT